MTNHTPEGKIQTVLGLIRQEQLGVTLPHEHLLIDLSGLYQPDGRASAKDFFNQPVSLETLGRIRYYAAANADNYRLFDVSTAISEVMLYKQYGGDSIVDATSIGIARDPVGLARISRATGVNVIMGASFYIAQAHPPNMGQQSEDEIVEQIVSDVTEGVEGTMIKSGIIGEVGCSWPLTDNERKVLRASGRAQQLTGAPLLIHPGRDETAPLEIIDILAGVGADISHTIIGHLDRTIFRRSTLKQLAQTGCYLLWDLFGREESYYKDNPVVDMPNDAKRIEDIGWISSEGYGDKILVSLDICTKHRLERYGGHGYYYILEHIVPRMRTRGFTEEAIQCILVDNPKDALTFRKPRV